MICRDLFIAALLVVLGSVLLECFGSVLGAVPVSVGAALLLGRVLYAEGVSR